VRPNYAECIGTSKIQPVKSLGIFKDITMDPNNQINPWELTTHKHKNISMVNHFQG
jgi:hypothetical protein